MTEGVPALFDHCSRVYAAMDAQAVDEEQEVVEEGADPKNTNEVSVMGIRVYDGHLTKIFNDLQLAAPYYTSVNKALIGMGCIVQLRRGGGAQTSKWQLLKEPELEAFEGLADDKPSTLRQRVKFLESEVASLKHNQGVMMKALGVKL